MEGEVPYTLLHPNMPTSLEDLQKSWIQLKEERNTFEANFYASEKKVLELTRRLHEEQTLNTYIAPKRIRNVFLHYEFCNIFPMGHLCTNKFILINMMCVLFVCNNFEFLNP